MMLSSRLECFHNVAHTSAFRQSGRNESKFSTFNPGTRENQEGPLQELATITGCDLKNISEDVKVLVEMGLVDLTRQNRAKQPHLACEGIRLEIAI